MAWLTIIGGGLAGLSLSDAILAIYEQANKSLPGNIEIYEKRPSFIDDRSYCFFADAESETSSQQQYSEWTFSRKNDTKEIIHRSNSLHYHRLSGIDVLSGLLERNNAHPQVTVHMASEASAEQFQGLVVDTRPASVSKFTIKQSFLGREINLGNIENRHRAVLMGNMRLEEGHFTFDYILPTDEGKALLEVTQFSFETPRKEVLDRLWSRAADNYGFCGDITREECAVLPMGLNSSDDNALSSQQLRWGTGYGYLETKQWANACAEALIFENRPLYPAKKTLLNRFDSVLLRIIKNQPAELPSIFMRMATELSPEQFARFMTTPRVNDLIRVMKAVPKRPFIRTLYGG